MLPYIRVCVCTRARVFSACEVGLRRVGYFFPHRFLVLPCSNKDVDIVEQFCNVAAHFYMLCMPLHASHVALPT